MGGSLLQIMQLSRSVLIIGKLFLHCILSCLFSLQKSMCTFTVNGMCAYVKRKQYKYKNTL